MELSLEEVKVLLTGTCRLENEFRRKENDMRGQSVTELRKSNRAKLKLILDIQNKLIAHKCTLESNN